MEPFVIMFCAIFGTALLYTVAARFWFLFWFRRYVLGWKHADFNEELVRRAFANVICHRQSWTVK